MTDEDEMVMTMTRAITAVRREWYKAVFITAVLDGTVVGLVANLLLTLLDFDLFARPYATIAVGCIGVVTSLVYRLRQPSVERFETVNPALGVALRTARDAIEQTEPNTMTRALYADVLDRLKAASSLGLLNMPRIAARFGLALALGIAVVQASSLGFAIGAGPTAPNSGGDGHGALPGQTSTPGGLQPGDEVLGTPEAVTPGGDNLSAEIGRQPGAGEDDRQREYETGGLGDGRSVEAERVEYAPPEDLENAELIKEYNLRIREETDD